MNMRLFALAAPLMLALVLVVAPIAAHPARAQMGQMPTLDQLTGDDFDKAFLAQMTMHHAMAVMMARPAAAQAAHQETRDLAQTIINDQTREIAQMRGWAKDWYGLDVPDPIAMMDQMMGQGMGMPMGQMMGQMPMMHHMTMMNDMAKLPPQRLEVVFLSQMIPHHQGAIDMANLVPERAAHQELKDLSKNIIDSQSSEIDRMNGWLSSWYSL
jgi:uncharacterized protein (DUF305 family)